VDEENIGGRSATKSIEVFCCSSLPDFASAQVAKNFCRSTHMNQL
jgi:hypothetical protein